MTVNAGDILAVHLTRWGKADRQIACFNLVPFLQGERKIEDNMND